AAPSPPLCFGESATVVIDTPFTNATQIYGIPPADMFNCLGYAFDARASNIADGFACVASVATDALGNRSVSAPLRICIDANNDQVECPAWGTIITAGLPACTGTYNPATHVVSNTPCTPRRFPTVANDYELIYP
ncbi:MAG: hypothetical protein H0T79_04460, partial [Deltaproteobacteria bacterium]|nr:hypothetical protein [Deltaproteobacteria bacterium]